MCLNALCCSWRSGFGNIHSRGVQVWNAKLQVLVLTELPRTVASLVRVCMRVRSCVDLIDQVQLLDP